MKLSEAVQSGCVPRRATASRRPTSAWPWSRVYDRTNSAWNDHDGFRHVLSDQASPDRTPAILIERGPEDNLRRVWKRNSLRPAPTFVSRVHNTTTPLGLNL